MFRESQPLLGYQGGNRLSGLRSVEFSSLSRRTESFHPEPFRLDRRVLACCIGGIFGHLSMRFLREQALKTGRGSGTVELNFLIFNRP